VLPAVKILALDVGGSSVKSALVTDGVVEGEIRRTPLDSQGAAAELLAAFHAIIDAYPESEALAFAFPGPFDYARGICWIEGVDKFGSLYGANLADALGRGRPARFCNDAEAAILGEAQGAGARRILGVTLGTGLGSAFVVEGAPVVSGPGVPPHGWLYNQPFRDTVADEVFSIRGLRRRAGREPADIEDASVWQAFGTDLGQFLAPFAEAFEAEAVLVLGGIANAWPRFGEALRARLPLARPGRLGASAALLGAASLYSRR